MGITAYHYVNVRYKWFLPISYVTTMHKLTLVIPLLMFLISIPSIPVATASGSSPPPVVPGDGCSRAGFTIPAVSNASALAIASASPTFTNLVKGQTFHLGGTSAWGHCTKLVSINANFIATNATGYKEDIVVSMNVSSSNTPTVVSGVQVLPAVSFYSYCNGGQSPCQNPNWVWSGYQFCDGWQSGGANCQNPQTNQVFGVQGSFTQPNVYAPTGSNQPNCGTGTCDMASWVGLDTYTTGQYILQTGTFAYLICNPFCGGSYKLWWEDLESSSSLANWCPQVSTSPGHTIIPVVQQQTGNNYYVYVTDQSTGTCYSTPYPYTGYTHTPYWGDFIIERSQYCSNWPVCGMSLAKFDNYWFQGIIAYNGAPNGVPISRPFGNGWYQSQVMVNPPPSGVTNVCSGSWSSPNCYVSVQSGSTGYGKFYNTWISSQNT